MIFLAADVGGTNTRLILADYSGAHRTTLYEKKYPSEQYYDFYEIVALFLKESNITAPLDAACIAVAGPVKNAEASVTNLPWNITEKALKKILQTQKVKLINDFAAVSYGVSELKGDEVEIIQQGKPAFESNPSAVIIGAGTGLGVSHRVWIHDRYHVLTSEAGHTAFAPQDKLQTRLLNYMQKESAYVSLENVLSGRGFQHIYHFLQHELSLDESAEIKHLFEQQDPAQVITQAAMLKKDELCEKTVELFISIYGAAAGNAALYYYPVDEVYIAGGIAPKINLSLNSETFVSALTTKGLMSENMQILSVKLINQDAVGLSGALIYARSLFNDER